MAPTVPFALLGVVQLGSVAVWLGFAAAACLPARRHRLTPFLVVGATAMAVADALTALRLTAGSSDSLGELRIASLALLAVGLLAGSARPRASTLGSIVAPLGTKPSIAAIGAALGAAATVAAAVDALRNRRDQTQRAIAGWIAVAMALTAIATWLAEPARHGTDAALAVLAARGAASLALVAALVLIARDSLLGKLLGAIVAGVVAMAIGAVAVVGIGVANEVQHDQSARLLSVAKAQQRALQTLATQAGLLAHVVASCPSLNRQKCIGFLDLFSDEPGYFAVIEQRGAGVRTVAPHRGVLSRTALLQLAGSVIARTALAESTSPQAVEEGPLLLDGSPPKLAIVAAVPGRPGGSTNAQISPTFAAIYGVDLTGSDLKALTNPAGYDVSIIAGDQVLASSLSAAAARQVVATAIAHGVSSAGPTATYVAAAQGQTPTVAFVPINEANNGNVRIATLAISQSASVALAAQRSVLRRLVLTALAALVIVALGAFALAQRVVDPLRRLTIAAGRVRGGDLDTVVAIETRDEVGSLARAFDAMTSSLRGLTGDLRSSAAQESALRARLEAVVGSMTDGLVTTDGEDRVAGANPTALRLLGQTEPDLVGRPLAEVVDLRGSDGEVIDRRTPLVTADAMLHRADGAQVAVRVAVAPLTGQPGQVIVVSDRTRDREIERMKTEFLSNISHELRTPLTPIRGYAELIAHRPDLPSEQVQAFVAEILAGTMRMNRAVDLLVDVAALEAGRIAPDRSETAVAVFVEERLAQWRALYPDRAADLRRRVAAKLPAVDVDPVWLSKALGELVDNAVKHTPTGTSIVVTASLTDAGDVRIAVRDAGKGIDTERLGELLGDFSQADASQTRHVGGLGLGLGFVTRVAAQLGLAIHVSSSPGRGAEFALDLPPAASQPVPSTSTAAAPPRAAAKSKRRR
jgi:PAS domain S-box-containing protein